MGKHKDEAPESNGGGKKFFLMLLAGVGGALFFWKRKRDRELDEALWEEPRDL